MGCTASKLDNEDTVRRCKERRRLIKDAVFARHHLAAAHADYCRSLRVTGVALSDFAAGEPLLVVSPSTPSVLINNNQSSHSHNRFSSTTIPKSPSSLSTSSSFKPPPPIKTVPAPPPPFSPTIASSKLPHILSSSSVKSNPKNLDNNVVEKVKVKKAGPKLPHILSDSSVSSSTPKSSAFDFLGETTYVGIPNSNYASTPSQASSVWNWDHFYPPPSPPASEFFHQSSKNEFSHQGHNGNFDEDERERERERESEREEVHCSEWGDHYSTTSSESDEDDNHTKDDDDEEGDVDGDDERESRSEISELRTRSHFGSSSVRSEAGPALKKVEERSEDGASSSSSRRWKNNGGGGGGGREVCGSDEMRIVVRHKDLKEIVVSLKEYFDKAADAGDHVSEMLETGRAQLDRSFRQLKSMFLLIYNWIFVDSQYKVALKTVDIGNYIICCDLEYT